MEILRVIVSLQIHYDYRVQRCDDPKDGCSLPFVTVASSISRLPIGEYSQLVFFSASMERQGDHREPGRWPRRDQDYMIRTIKLWGPQKPQVQGAAVGFILVQFHVQGGVLVIVEVQNQLDSPRPPLIGRCQLVELYLKESTWPRRRTTSRHW